MSTPVPLTPRWFAVRGRELARDLERGVESLDNVWSLRKEFTDPGEAALYLYIWALEQEDLAT